MTAEIGLFQDSTVQTLFGLMPIFLFQQAARQERNGLDSYGKDSLFGNTYIMM